MQLARDFHFSSGRQSCPRFKTICCLGPERGAKGFDELVLYVVFPYIRFFGFFTDKHAGILPGKQRRRKYNNNIQALH